MLILDGFVFSCVRERKAISEVRSQLYIIPFHPSGRLNPSGRVDWGIVPRCSRCCCHAISISIYLQLEFTIKYSEETKASFIMFLSFPSYSILPKRLCREGGCRSRNPHPNTTVSNHSIGLYRSLPNAKEGASLHHMMKTIKHPAGMRYIGEVAVIDVQSY